MVNEKLQIVSKDRTSVSPSSNAKDCFDEPLLVHCQKPNITKSLDSGLHGENAKLPKNFISNVYKVLQFKSNENQDSKLFKFGGMGLLLTLVALCATGSYFMCGTNWFDESIQKVISLSNGTYVFKLWSETKLDLLANFYVFNYTNVDAVISGKEKPLLQELGPYVFKHEISKWNIEFNGTDKVTYSENITNTFVHELSNGTLADFIYTPNLVLIAVLNTIRKMSMASQLSFYVMAKSLGMKPFIKLTVREFLLGYNEHLDVFNDIVSFLDQDKTATFGILANSDGVVHDKITIGTGIPDLNSIGVIQQYNGRSEMTDFDGEECNNFTASDGVLFPAELVKKNAPFYFYKRLLCRRYPLVYQKDTVTPQGYPAKRYVFPKDLYASGDVNPSNKCFCEENCLPSGLFDVGRCYYGIPIFISNPHFLDGDPSLCEDILGLAPDPEKHSFQLDIHRAGMSISGSAKWQAGIVLRKARYVPFLKKLKEGIALPIVWASVRPNDNLNSTLDSLVYHLSFTAPRLKHTLQWSFPLLTAVFLSALICLVCKMFSTNKI